MAITACFYLVPILLLFLASIPRGVLVSIIGWLLFPFYLTVSLVTGAKIQEQLFIGLAGWDLTAHHFVSSADVISYAAFLIFFLNVKQGLPPGT